MNSLMHPFRGWVVAGLMAVLLAGVGCVKIDSTLTINRDGNGALRAMYGMPAFLVRQLEVTRQWTRILDLAEGKTNNIPYSALEIPMIFDEEVLKSRFQKMEREGITLESLRLRDQGGWKYVDFTIKFQNLESLMKQSFFTDCGVEFKRLVDDNCKLSIALPDTGLSAHPGSLSTSESLAKLTPFLNGMKIVVRLDLPGEIRNSTSSMSDSRRATWEWDFDKDVHVLDRLSQEKIIVIFDGAGSRIRDFEKRVGSSLLIFR